MFLFRLFYLFVLTANSFRPWAAIIIWLIISAPFLISREAPFLIQALCFLPSQIIAIAVPAFILYRAGLRTTEKDMEILTASVVPNTIKD